ncbi:DNA-binding transcriptional activator of the SARP family [Micromonospora pallida]|uniref:DNA-binding transcriptional activator of the SARP family n=1 Tax=Micromonospora pallida TaxID=145854 RepID=A0A1C6S8G4_9ACTN|nr:AfsR/SARP family transcriptional regulator [Micromonospora pallida]SCL25766.1 DNA-binding transcriptional activator of the SARP family [Micromonospora pallida]
MNTDLVPGGSMPGHQPDLPATRISVLGPLRLEHLNHTVHLGPKVSGLLSALVLHAGKPADAGQLIDLLWGKSASAAAETTLRSHVSHLRQKLGLPPGPHGPVATVRTVGTSASRGYLLELARDSVDVQVFESAVVEGSRLLRTGGTAEARRAAKLLRDGLALWRGTAFADIAHWWGATAEINRLDALRRSAMQVRAEALIETGSYLEATGELAGMVAVDPYNEKVRRLLALALYADQRVDEAAEVCREGLTLLACRGLDAPDLHELQRRILRRTVSVGRRPPVPRVLPPAPPIFVGRHAELAAGIRLLAGTGESPRTLVLGGPAGIGKSTFAVHLAHRLADDLPGGQLYVDLRGFDAVRPPLSVPDVIRTVLRAMGVSPERLPVSVDGQLALYRSLLVDRRMLIVFDNVAGAQQVRPLLPAAAGCPVIVASRSRLTSLVATGASLPLSLGPLSGMEARELLDRRLGAERTAAEPVATTELVDYCDGNPLALAVIAAQAADFPGLRLAQLVAELRVPEFTSAG